MRGSVGTRRPLRRCSGTVPVLWWPESGGVCEVVWELVVLCVAVVGRFVIASSAVIRLVSAAVVTAESTIGHHIVIITTFGTVQLA